MNCNLVYRCSNSQTLNSSCVIDLINLQVSVKSYNWQNAISKFGCDYVLEHYSTKLNCHIKVKYSYCRRFLSLLHQWCPIDTRFWFTSVIVLHNHLIYSEYFMISCLFHFRKTVQSTMKRNVYFWNISLTFSESCVM